MDVKSERRKQGLSAEHPTADPDAVDVRANAAFNTPAKIAYFALFIFICGSAIALLTMLIRADNSRWTTDIASILIGTVLVFGPVFGAIMWATRRHFKNRHSSKDPRC